MNVKAQANGMVNRAIRKNPRTRKFSVAEIARWFEVPPHMMGDIERLTGIRQQCQAALASLREIWAEATGLGKVGSKRSRKAAAKS